MKYDCEKNFNFYENEAEHVYKARCQKNKTAV